MRELEKEEEGGGEKKSHRPCNNCVCGPRNRGRGRTAFQKVPAKLRLDQGRDTGNEAGDGGAMMRRQNDGGLGEVRGRGGKKIDQNERDRELGDRKSRKWREKTRDRGW